VVPWRVTWWKRKAKKNDRGFDVGLSSQPERIAGHSCQKTSNTFREKTLAAGKKKGGNTRRNIRRGRTERGSFFLVSTKSSVEEATEVENSREKQTDPVKPSLEADRGRREGPTMLDGGSLGR